MREPLRERARGRWPSILQAFGIGSEFLRNRHSPCPVCDGRDRFRFDNKDGAGTFICSNCGAGDGVRLLMNFKGWEFKEMAEEVEKIIGSCPVTSISKGIAPEKARKAKNALWNTSQPITLNDPAGIYLRRRCGVTEFPATLRYAPKCVYRNEDSGVMTTMPALVAMVHGSDGVPVNLQRIYLTPEGQKADVEAAKKLMAGGFPEGSAVRLYEPKKVLGIAEGIETAYCAEALFKVPVWAALTADNLEKFRAPEGVEKLLVFGDNDESLTGHASAYKCARAHRLKGLQTEQFFPEKIGDWANEYEEVRATA